MRKRNGPKASLIYLHRPVVSSTAVSADCSVCGRGLLEGYRVTARALPGVGVRLFCSVHCP